MAIDRDRRERARMREEDQEQRLCALERTVADIVAKLDRIAADADPYPSSYGEDSFGARPDHGEWCARCLRAGTDVEDL